MLQLVEYISYDGISLKHNCLNIYFILVTGENGNTAEGITKEKILNQPLLEEGTFLSYASKVITCCEL